MVSICVNGEDKTGQISDWTIWRDDKQNELLLTCRFPSGKSYSRPLGDCEITPTREVQEKLIGKKGSAVLSAIDSAVIYGEKYAVVRYPGSLKDYVMHVDGVEFFPETTIKDEAIFCYFVSVAEARVGQARPQNKPIAENVLRQLEKTLPHAGTALHAYCTGRNAPRGEAGDLIYPFGVNESQLEAVKQAFASQISLIEGPPGTGKTQTILNIVANIILRGKTVAILSNNNAAVKNVYEKLGKAGLDYLLAKLGSTENRKDFFSNASSKPSVPSESAPDMRRIQAILKQLEQHLHAKNEAARLQAEIDELAIERRYLQQWRRENGVEALPPLEKYRLSPRKTTDLLAYLTYLAENRIGLRDRIELLLKFGILLTKPFDDWEKRKSMIYALQLHYYDKALQEKTSALADSQEKLKRAAFEILLDNLTTCSMAHLKCYLHQQIPNQESFDSKNYRNDFDAFLKRYPIIGSSTHSIINSIGNGVILDYVIIDEASQQDIVPGILALGCSRNLIVVGDRKQIPHIPANLGIVPPSEFYDCDKYSLLDSCIGIFKDSIPRTLLKEHYRCHPKIIQFCNRQFYDSQLIPMTQEDSKNPLKLIITAKGNHTRGHSNQRELDSLLETLEWDGECARGFIAPYNEQVFLSREYLPADFVIDTVHKFQGRECDEIVFSTVLDKKSSSRRNLSFVDDPYLINVAVSRAKKRFTLVTGDNVFYENNGHIAALMRYIEYYAEKGSIHRASVISAFDLLYKEYDSSLFFLNSRLKPRDSRYKSEQIVAEILRNMLSQKFYPAIIFHHQIKLIQLVPLTYVALTERERDFMRNHARCDFVLYFEMGKKPLGVIEVDGGTHGAAKQVERDALKDSILRKSNIPLLRLRTVESHIEKKIAEFLARCIGNGPVT